MNKDIIREKLKAKRAALSNDYRQAASDYICEAIIDSAEYQNAQSIMLYSAINTEVNVDKLINKALQDGKRTGLPYCYKDGIMQGYYINDLTELSIGRFDILQPKPIRKMLIDPKKLQLIIVPMLGFTAECNRIGYGGGYYDRYLMHISDKCYIIGVAFEEQRCEQLPLMDNDIPMRSIYTQKSIYHRRHYV